MRIAFFSETFLPVHDGVGHVLDDLGRQLVAAGHEVTLYTTRLPGQPAEETVRGGMRVRRFRSLPVPLYGQYRWALFPLAHVLRRSFVRSTDLVHVHTAFMMGSAGLFAARRWGFPLIGTFHTDLRAMRVSFARSLWTRLLFPLGGYYSEGVYWRCDATTAPTPEALRTLRGRFKKPPRGELLVVPNGIDTGRFRPGVRDPDWHARLGSRGRPLVTFLGRLTVDKGVHTFLDALAGLPGDPEFLAVVGGGGVERAHVERRVREEERLRSRVVVVGPVADDEKPALLSQSRIFVLPSTADTSSVSTLEAMASGCACVVTDRGGARELVEEGQNGLLVDPTDPSAVGRAVLRLLEGGKLAGTLGAAGVAYVRSHASIDRTAQAYLEIYDRWTGGGRRDRRPPATSGVGRPGSTAP